MRKEQTNSLSLRYNQIKGEAKQEISMTDAIIRMGIDPIVEIEEFNLVVDIQYGQNHRGRLRYEQGYKNDIRRENVRGNTRTYQNQNFRRQNNRGWYRGSYRKDSYERGRSRSRERSYLGNLGRNDKRHGGWVDSMSDSESTCHRFKSQCCQLAGYVTSLGKMWAPSLSAASWLVM